MREEIRTFVDVISNTHYADLQNKVNSVLHQLEKEKNEIIDIKFSCTSLSPSRVLYSCMIIYKETTYRWEDEL